MQSDRTHLSELLMQLRAESGLSFKALSALCYVDTAYLYRLEHGQSQRPSRDVLIKIGIGLGLDVQAVDELLTVAGHLPLLRGPGGTVGSEP